MKVVGTAVDETKYRCMYEVGVTGETREKEDERREVRSGGERKR